MPIQWFVKRNPACGVTTGIWQDAQALAGDCRQLSDGGELSPWQFRQVPSYCAKPLVNGACGSWQSMQSRVRPLFR